MTDDKIDEDIELLAVSKSDRSASVPAVQGVKNGSKLTKSHTVDGSGKKVTIKDQKKSAKSGSKNKGRNKRRNPNLSCRSLIFALLVRVMFSLHAAIAFWRVTVIKDTLIEAGMIPWMWKCNLGGIGLLFLETFITLLYRGGRDYKWFCPCVFFYLVSIIPSMIMLEYDQFHNECIVPDRSRRDVLNSTIATAISENPLELNVTESAAVTTNLPISTTVPLVVHNSQSKDIISDLLFQGKIWEVI